jgi:arylsulfatase A-like enzyme/Flp pilus assembly protein TadD
MRGGSVERRAGGLVVRIGALAVALLAAGTCGEGSLPEPPVAAAGETQRGAATAPPRPGPLARPGLDVLLITIDTLRADALGFAGNARAATPVLDRLASSGRVFPFAHAHNVVTLPSHANLLTGLYPFQHGVRENSGFRLPPTVPTLATILAGAGYRTAAFVAAFPLDSRFGLDRGFSVYDDRFPEGSHPTEFVLAERRGDEVVALARRWWQAERGRRRFAWVHLFDPHAPYSPPEPFASRFAGDPYLGEVAATDAFLAPLLEPFLAGEEPPALVVLTSDHGEALGDHGEATHGLFAYEATLRVPLVLWGAGVEPGRDGRPARHVDVLPTVLEAAGVARPQGELRYPGSSLLAPPPSGAAADSYFEALSAALNRGWAPLAGLIRDGRKAISLPLPELYHLPQDPQEAANLVAEERRLARTLLDALPAEAAWPPPRREDVPPEVAARLGALGYVAAPAPAKSSYGPEDDPKRLIHLDAKIHQVVDLYSRRRVPEAVALARELVAERPEMGIGYSFLSQALLEAGETVEAVAVMERARGAKLASEALLRQLGLSLAELGRAAEAVELLRPLAGTGDPDSGNTFAVVLSEAGRQEEAARVLREVLAADPDNPKAFETLGLVALRQGRWAEARERSEEALALNAGLPWAWNNLGVALYQLGRHAEALDAWQKAVEVDPRLFDALFNLGVKAAAHGRPQVARRALERFLAGAPPGRYGPDLARARELLAQLGGAGR